MAIPTAAERESRRQALQGRAAPPVPITPPPESRRAEVKARQVESELLAAEEEAAKGEGDLYTQILAKVKRENLLMTPEAAREEARSRMEQMAPGPYYVGGFKPVEFKSALGGVLPAARPQDLPVSPEKPVTFTEALSPQTRAGERAVDKVKRQSTASIFNDKAFNESITALPDSDKREQLDAYEAYKAAFKKIRDLNPLETSGVTDEDIKRDLDRQLKALGSGDIKTFVDNPANRMGYGGDPLARAFQKQVTTGAPIPILEPGQTEFVSTLDRLKRTRATAAAISAAEKRLRQQGVPITKTVRKPTGERGPGGRPVFEETEVPTGQFRPATAEEISRAKTYVSEFTDKEMPKPLYAEAGKLDQFFSANDKAAKGGVIFQKELPSGATVESPVSFFVRSALSVPNALVGAVSEVFTPEEVTKRERAARPPLYKDSSAAIYSVAQSRGLMGEIGDLYEYAPETWTLGGKPLKEYTTYAKAAGFAGDIIGFDLGLIGGAVTGLRGGAAGARAARAAGEGVGAAAKAAGSTSYKAASKEFLETIGLTSVAKSIPLGDVRLQFGVSLGDSMRAADEYRAVLQRTGSPADALRAAETVAPRSKFVADAATSPPQSVTDINDIFKGATDEWSEVKRVGDSVRALQSATGSGADLAAVRPYIAAAVRNTPEITARIQAQTGKIERLTVRQILDDVNSQTPDVAKDFYNKITEAVTVEKGFQGIDRAVGAIEPGRFSIRLTPNTFTTSDNVDDILKDVRSTDEYKNVQQITRGGVDEGGFYTIPDVQLPNGETLKGQLLEHIEREGASGTFPRSQLARVVEGVDNGVITGDDLRLLMQSVTDTVAAAGGKRSFPERALAEGERQAVPRGFPVKDAPRPALRSEGQTAGLFNRGWIAVADRIDRLAKGPSNMSQYLSRPQIRILEEGKRKMSGLKALMAAELKALREQGITDSYDQAAALVGNLNSTDTWRNIARSSIFGRSDTSIMDLITGDIIYKDPFNFLNAAGRDQLGLVVDAAAARGTATPNDIDEFINTIRLLADNDKYTLPGFIKGGGVVFDLRDKPIEVLASAWARGKVDQISSDTIARVLDFEPDTIGALTQALRYRLGARRTADGRLISDLPINAVVGDTMKNGGLMSSDPGKLKGIKLFNDEVDKIPDISAADKILIKGLVSNPAGLMRAEVDATYSLLAAKYGNDADIIAAEGAKLFKGEATLGELGGPMGSALGKAVRDDFGKSPDFEGFTKELGVLAELGTKGPTSSGALRASRFMTSALDTYNSIFYNLVLSANPRYHGTNFVTGPFIGYTTTGRVSSIPDLFSGAKVIGRGENAAARAEVIAIDQTTGVPITLGELYDKAVKGGVFRSQLQAQIDPRFLDDAKSLGLATMTGGGKATNKVLNTLRYPAEAANASDFVWRMSYVVDAIKQGKGVDEALDVGRRSLYDYGSATPWERKYVAKNILFYNFFRNSLLETGRQALTSPARLARQARLTQDFSKLQVGDEKWNEMRFYTPYDAGVARIVLGFAPQAGREGSITLFPNMPWYDAAYIMSGILTTPGNLLQGVADPVTGKRDYGSGYIFNKLGPGGQAAISFFTGADMLADIKLTKDRAPIPHVAVMDELGLLPMYTRFFNIKKIPAADGQTGWNGYIYTMEPDDFERYRTFIKGSKLLGAQRPVDDFSKWFATWDLPSTGPDGVTGPAETATLTPAEAMGVTLDTKAGVPAEAELSAPKTRARQFKEDVKTATPTREELKARRAQ